MRKLRYDSPSMPIHLLVLTLLADRYCKDDIYTWASTTLVAVNPYKDVDHLYYQETQQEFSTLAQSDAVSRFTFLLPLFMNSK